MQMRPAVDGVPSAPGDSQISAAPAIAGGSCEQAQSSPAGPAAAAPAPSPGCAVSAARAARGSGIQHGGIAHLCRVASCTQASPALRIRFRPAHGHAQPSNGATAQRPARTVMVPASRPQAERAFIVGRARWSADGCAGKKEPIIVQARGVLQLVEHARKPPGHRSRPLGRDAEADTVGLALRCPEKSSQLRSVPPPACAHHRRPQHIGVFAGALAASAPRIMVPTIQGVCCDPAWQSDGQVALCQRVSSWASTGGQLVGTCIHAGQQPQMHTRNTHRAAQRR